MLVQPPEGMSKQKQMNTRFQPGVYLYEVQQADLEWDINGDNTWHEDSTVEDSSMKEGARRRVVLTISLSNPDNTEPFTNRVWCYFESHNRWKHDSLCSSQGKDPDEPLQYKDEFGDIVLDHGLVSMKKDGSYLDVQRFIKKDQEAIDAMVESIEEARQTIPF